MESCARFDALNEYAKGTRMVWAGLIVLALINFGVGCLASSQKLVRFEYYVSFERGMTETVNAEWFEEVNALSGEYRASGYDDDCLDLKKYDYSVISSALWMKENAINELTEDMVYTVSMSGEFELRRSAGVQLVIEPKNGRADAWQVIPYAPQAEDNGFVEGSTVFLVPPGRPLPDICAKLYIRQGMDLSEFIAAQRYYQVDLGTVLTDEAVSNADFPPDGAE